MSRAIAINRVEVSIVHVWATNVAEIVTYNILFTRGLPEIARRAYSCIRATTRKKIVVCKGARWRKFVARCADAVETPEIPRVAHSAVLRMSTVARAVGIQKTAASLGLFRTRRANLCRLRECNTQKWIRSTCSGFGLITHVVEPCAIATRTSRQKRAGDARWNALTVDTSIPSITTTNCATKRVLNTTITIGSV